MSGRYNHKPEQESFEKIKSGSQIFITCNPGIAPILHDELLELGFSNLEPGKLGVRLPGSYSDCVQLNLQLRTANKILLELESFQARDANELYNFCSGRPWEDLFSSSGYFSIDGFVRNNSIKDNRYAFLKFKDAVVDRFRKVSGRRPDSGKDKSGTCLFLFWNGSDCQVYLDTSGKPISFHEYRKNPFKAPLSEALAAACVRASDWDGSSPFLNPMCGSGTLAIEAALIAMKKFPGAYRRDFGFMHTQYYDSTFHRKLQNRLKAGEQRIRKIIHASDQNREAIRSAIANARLAGVEHLINFEISDFKDSETPSGPGVIIMNPEYGERLGEKEELELVYSEIGNFFKNSLPGFKGYILTGNMDLAKKVGLRSARKIPLYNGKIECRLLEYNLYSGSKLKHIK